MIYCSLREVDRYRGLGANFDLAIDFLLDTDLDALPDGSFAIDSERVFGSVATNTLKAREETTFEGHERYADLQLILQGGELILVLNKQFGMAEGEPCNDFQRYLTNTQGDQNPSTIYCPLVKKDLLILFPEDLHAPGLSYEPHRQSRKLVIKIRLD